MGSTVAEDVGGRSAGRSTSHADSQGEVKQALLVVPVHMTAGAGECLQHLIGAWLQSILRKWAPLVLFWTDILLLDLDCI